MAEAQLNNDELFAMARAVGLSEDLHVHTHTVNLNFVNPMTKEETNRNVDIGPAHIGYDPKTGEIRKYVRGWCHMQDAWRLFRLDHITVQDGIKGEATLPDSWYPQRSGIFTDPVPVTLYSAEEAKAKGLGRQPRCLTQACRYSRTNQ